MQKSTARVTSTIASTLLAASVTISLGWPSRVNAVGNDEQAVQQQGQLAEKAAAPANVVLAKNESKIGDLEVTATLVDSEKAPGNQAIRLECKNPTEGRIAGKVLVALTRTKGSGMERVMPRPQIAWRQVETVTLEPGASLVRELALPKNIAAEVTRIEKARKVAEEAEIGRAPNVYFNAIAEAVEAPATKSKNQSPLSTRLSKMTMMVPPKLADLGL